MGLTATQYVLKVQKYNIDEKLPEGTTAGPSSRFPTIYTYISPDQDDWAFTSKSQEDAYLGLCFPSALMLQLPSEIIHVSSPDYLAGR